VFGVLAKVPRRRGRGHALPPPGAAGRRSGEPHPGPARRQQGHLVRQHPERESPAAVQTAIAETRSRHSWGERGRARKASICGCWEPAWATTCSRPDGYLNTRRSTWAGGARRDG